MIYWACESESWLGEVDYRLILDLSEHSDPPEFIILYTNIRGVHRTRGWDGYQEVKFNFYVDSSQKLLKGDDYDRT